MTKGMLTTTTTSTECGDVRSVMTLDQVAGMISHMKIKLFGVAATHARYVVCTFDVRKK